MYLYFEFIVSTLCSLERGADTYMYIYYYYYYYYVDVQEMCPVKLLWLGMKAEHERL